MLAGIFLIVCALLITDNDALAIASAAYGVYLLM